MQVAAFLGVHRRKVAEFLNDELIPKPIMLASYPKWRREELEDWVAARCPEQKFWKWQPSVRVTLGTLVEAMQAEVVSLRGQLDRLQRLDQDNVVAISRR